MGTYQVDTEGGSYQIDTEEAPGKLESFGRGAANNFPLAPQAIAGGEALTGVGDEGGYSKNLASWNAKAQSAKEANPVSYGAGAVAGAAAPLLIPGVGEALEAAPVAGNALYGGLNAISNTDLTKDPGGIAKQAAIGAGIGGTLGAATQGIGSALSKTAPIGDRLEANATANALDLGTFGVKKLARGNQNPETAMLNINKNLKELLPDTVGLTDTAASKFNKLSEAHDKAGEILGHVVDSVTKSGMDLPEIDEAINELGKEAAKYNTMTSARSVDAKAELMDTITRLNELKQSGNATFKNLSDLKSDIGSAYHNPNFQNHGVDKSYGILSDKIDAILDRVAVEDPSIKPMYDKSKQIYRLTSQLLPAMKRGVSREVAGTGGGLTNAALGAGAVLGHPIAAGAGYAGKTAIKLAAPDLAANTAYKTVNALRGSEFPSMLSQTSLNEMNDFLTQKYGNQKELKK